ncbi:dehydrogenase/reductase SDR family member 4-like [Glandiceps talaboti]
MSRFIARGVLSLCKYHSRYQNTNTLVRMASTSAAGSRKLDGKVAVVTASTDGIGFAIARKLAEDGAHVVISSRKQNNVDKAVETLKSENLSVSGMVCHVGKPEDRTKLLQSAAEKSGGIDILVSNAAVNPSFGPILDTTEKVWDKIFEINVKVAFFLSKEAIPYMEKRGGGSIVFVSSIGGYNSFELIAPYSVSKTALLGLTKAMAPQCATMNIRVNAIAPGVIKTKFSQAIVESDEGRSLAEQQTALKRLGEPSECAGAVSFLCSDDASYITGETIIMAGGMPSRL